MVVLGRKELDLGPAREPLQLSLVEPAERVAPRQELGDVMHATLPGSLGQPESAAAA